MEKLLKPIEVEWRPKGWEAGQGQPELLLLTGVHCVLKVNFRASSSEGILWVWGGQRCSHFEAASEAGNTHPRTPACPFGLVMVRITLWALVLLVVPSWVSQDWGAAASDELNVCFP